MPLICAACLSGLLIAGGVLSFLQRRKIIRLESENRVLASRLQELQTGLEEIRHAISHDLSAPLRAVDGFSEILQKRLGSSETSDRDGFLSLIRENTAVMKSMVADMRDYIRVINASVQLQPVDVNGLIDACFRKCIDVQKTDSALLEMDPLPRILADPDLLRLMLMHLLSNAVKFRDGGRPCRIRIKPEGGSILIQDNGVGFDMAYQNKIYQFFYRLHLKEQFEGNGAGLALVRRIVQKHNGSISIQSELGRGTRVAFCFPDPAEKA